MKIIIVIAIVAIVLLAILLLCIVHHGAQQGKSMSKAHEEWVKGGRK